MKTQAWSWKAKQIWPKCLTSFTSLDLFKQRLSITTYHFDKLYKTLKILTRRVGSDCRKENANRWSSPTNLDSCLMGGAWCQTEIWTESQLPLTAGNKKKNKTQKVKPFILTPPLTSLVCFETSCYLMLKATIQRKLKLFLSTNNMIF